MLGSLIGLLVAIVVAAVVFKIVIVPMLFRVVVGTNEIHVVQSVNHTTAYGKGQRRPRVGIDFRWELYAPTLFCRRIVKTNDLEKGANK